MSGSYQLKIHKLIFVVAVLALEPSAFVPHQDYVMGFNVTHLVVYLFIFFSKMVLSYLPFKKTDLEINLINAEVSLYYLCVFIVVENVNTSEGWRKYFGPPNNTPV